MRQIIAYVKHDYTPVWLVIGPNLYISIIIKSAYYTLFFPQNHFIRTIKFFFARVYDYEQLITMRLKFETQTNYEDSEKSEELNKKREMRRTEYFRFYEEQASNFF